jgi:hypothetical protein
MVIATLSVTFYFKYELNSYFVVFKVYKYSFFNVLSRKTFPSL